MEKSCIKLPHFGDPDLTRSHALVDWYRPSRFDEIVCNEEAVHDLKYSIAKGQSGPFLVYGEPGTGKTTLSRIAARAHSCIAAPANGHEPCGVCGTCVKKQAAIVYCCDNEPGYHEISSFNKKMQKVGDMDAIVEWFGFGRSPLIVNQADELGKTSKRYLELLDRGLDLPLFFTAVTLDPLDSQFLSRCVIYRLEPIPDEVLTTYMVALADNERFDLATQDSREILSTIRRRGAAGQLRDALNELDKIRIRRSQ